MERRPSSHLHATTQMPLRALRPCKHMACIQLTRDADGYCEEHKRVANERDKYRGNARQRGYDSVWEKLRGVVLKENPLCHDCLSHGSGRPFPATEVHHIKKVRTHPELRLVKTNLMCLCKACHNRRTSKGE